uniref:Uncharacterized protein n=1 Tax=Mola mola TaxID=94237 RepID=A0A3Q3W4U4_MOLML
MTPPLFACYRLCCCVLGRRHRERWGWNWTGAPSFHLPSYCTTPQLPPTPMNHGVFPQQPNLNYKLYQKGRF